MPFYSLTVNEEVESTRIYFTFFCVYIVAKSKSKIWTRLDNRCIPLTSYLPALPQVTLELHQKY